MILAAMFILIDHFWIYGMFSSKMKVCFVLSLSLCVCVCFVDL